MSLHDQRRAIVRMGGIGGMGLGNGLGLDPITTYNIARAVYALAMRASPLVVRTVPLPENIDTIRQALLVLQDAERSSIDTANLYIERHNAGRMLREEYSEYDGMRHELHDAQVSYHGALRQACYDSLGRTLGDQVIARVPWPGWLPRLEGAVATLPDPPTVGRANGVDGLRGLGVAPIAIAAMAIAAIAGVALLVHEVTKFVDATSDAYVAHARARTLESVVEMRERVYMQCLGAGNQANECATRSIALTADLAALIREINAGHRRERMRRLIPALVGALVLAGGVATGVYYFRKKKGIAKPFGLFGAPKKRRKKAPKRRKRARGGLRGRSGLGAATRLSSLTDAVPSRYMLEV